MGPKRSLALATVALALLAPAKAAHALFEPGDVIAMVLVVLAIFVALGVVGVLYVVALFLVEARIYERVVGLSRRQARLTSLAANFAAVFVAGPVWWATCDEVAAHQAVGRVWGILGGGLLWLVLTIGIKLAALALTNMRFADKRGLLRVGALTNLVACGVASAVCVGGSLALTTT